MGEAFIPVYGSKDAIVVNGYRKEFLAFPGVRKGDFVGYPPLRSSVDICSIEYTILHLHESSNGYTTILYNTGNRIEYQIYSLYTDSGYKLIKSGTLYSRSYDICDVLAMDNGNSVIIAYVNRIISLVYDTSGVPSVVSEIQVLSSSLSKRNEEEVFMTYYNSSEENLYVHKYNYNSGALSEAFSQTLTISQIFNDEEWGDVVLQFNSLGQAIILGCMGKSNGNSWVGVSKWNCTDTGLIYVAKDIKYQTRPAGSYSGSANGGVIFNHSFYISENGMYYGFLCATYHAASSIGSRSSGMIVCYDNDESTIHINEEKSILPHRIEGTKLEDFNIKYASKSDRYLNSSYHSLLINDEGYSLLYTLYRTVEGISLDCYRWDSEMNDLEFHYTDLIASEHSFRQSDLLLNGISSKCGVAYSSYNLQDIREAPSVVIGLQYGASLDGGDTIAESIVMYSNRVSHDFITFVGVALEDSKNGVVNCVYRPSGEHPPE